MKMTFQEIRIIATGPCIANQLRDVNTICRRSWYIAAHVWKIYAGGVKKLNIQLLKDVDIDACIQMQLSTEGCRTIFIEPKSINELIGRIR